MDAVIVGLHRVLLSGGKSLLLVTAFSKAKPSLAPQVPSLGLLPSTQELISAAACLIGEPEVLAEVWGAG